MYLPERIVIGRLKAGIAEAEVNFLGNGTQTLGGGDVSTVGARL
jgi:hypothetical protein